MKRALLVLILLAFAGIGVGHIFKSEWFLRRSGVPRGGEMLTEWNRLGFQVAGAAFAGLAIYLLYILFQD